MATGVPDENENREPISPAVAAMLQAKTPNMTWDYVDWLKSACSLPVILIGVQRVVELLRAELVVSMGLAGKSNLASIDRSLVRLPGEKP